MASLKEQSERLFNLGLQYSEKSQLWDAIECYTKVINLTIEQYPTQSISNWDWNLERNRGFVVDDVYHEKKRKNIEKELELNPNLVMAYFERGKCKQELKDYHSAVLDYSEVIDLADYSEEFKLNPNFAMAYIARGKCQQELKNYDSALSDYDKSIKLADDSEEIKLHLDSSNIHYNIGICCEEYEEELDMSPSFAYELYGYRESYREPWELNELDMRDESEYRNRRCEMLERALVAYSKAIELNPSFADAYNHRGNCYIELDERKYNRLNRELALADYNKSIELNDGYAEAYHNRANRYSELKNYERALADYNKAIKLNPNYIEAYLNRLKLYVLTRKVELQEYQELFISEIICEISNIHYALSSSSKRTEESCIYAISLVASKEYSHAKSEIEHIFKDASPQELHHKAVYLKNIESAEELDRKNQDLEKLNTELEEKNKQLELAIQQKESVEKKMQKLVEQFTHSLGNVIFPDTIYQVAERLKNLPECRRDTLLLHEAYHAEIIIKLQAELLRQRYSNTNPEKFRLMIRNCRRNANAGEKTKTIDAILNYAVSRVTARFLNQHYAGLETIRNKILTQTHTDLNQLKQKFEDDILLHNCLSPLEWVSQNLRPIQITQISPLWKKVFILSDSYAEALLFGYFSEILFNAFKYADHESQEFLTLSFAEQTINDDIYLSCHWSNPTTNQKLSGLGTNQGLEAIAEDLKQLNSTEKPEQSLLICQQDNQFKVTLFFKKDLLINEMPVLTIKRKNREISHA